MRTIILVDDGNFLFYEHPTDHEEFCFQLDDVEMVSFPQYGSSDEPSVLTACTNAVSKGNSCLLVTDAHFTWATRPAFGGASLCASVLNTIGRLGGVGKAVILSSEPAVPLGYSHGEHTLCLPRSSPRRDGLRVAEWLTGGPLTIWAVDVSKKLRDVQFRSAPQQRPFDWKVKSCLEEHFEAQLSGELLLPKLSCTLQGALRTWIFDPNELNSQHLAVLAAASRRMTKRFNFGTFPQTLGHQFLKNGIIDSLRVSGPMRNGRDPDLPRELIRGIAVAGSDAAILDSLRVKIAMMAENNLMFRDPIKTVRDFIGQLVVAGFVEKEVPCGFEGLAEFLRLVQAANPPGEPEWAGVAESAAADIQWLLHFCSWFNGEDLDSPADICVSSEGL